MGIQGAGVAKGWLRNTVWRPVLRNRNYLFSAPASTLFLIMLYCDLKLLYNSSTTPVEVEISFSLS